MRFPLACLAWPLGPRAAATYDSGIDGRGVDGREKGPMQATSGPSARQNSPCRPARLDQPVQNSPCRPARRPTRYKTLPARPKTLISAHFSRAGRTFYRFRHQQPEQGELYPACRAASGTKLSPLAASAGDTGTKLSQHTSSYRNSAKKFTQHPTSRADPRKSSPSTRLLGLTREKVRPAGHKTPFLGHLSCAGRTFSRSRPHRSEQGE